MNAKNIVVAGACALGFLFTASAEDVKLDWFAENAASVTQALNAQGETRDGVWSNLPDQVTVDEETVTVDADDETAVSYRPKVELKGDQASILMSDVVFERAREELPALEEGIQAAVAVAKDADGQGVFAVVANGAWQVTEVPADPAMSYTIRCDFTYGDNGTVSYYLVDGDFETVLFEDAANPETDRVSSFKLAGYGSFSAASAVRAPSPYTIDFGPTLPEGVDSVTVNDEPLESGKATVMEGTQATIAFTAKEGWTVDPAEITTGTITGDIDYSGENFPAKVTRNDGWLVVTAGGTDTYSFELLSDALYMLEEGDTLMPAIAGESDLSVLPTTFDKDNLNALSIDCPFVIDTNFVTVDFRGRVLRDAVAIDGEEHPYLLRINAMGVEVKNGFLFGTTWRKDYELSGTDYRGIHAEWANSTQVSNCVIFVAAVEETVAAVEEAQIFFSGCWIDGQGDGAENVFVARNVSVLSIENTKGFWDPGNFWGVDDGVTDTLPAITGEQFALDNSTFFLRNTVVSNTVTHWSAGHVATPVTFTGGYCTELILDDGAFITAKDADGKDLPKVALIGCGSTVETDEDLVYEGDDAEIITAPGHLKIRDELDPGRPQYYVHRYIAKPQTFRADQIGVCSWTWHTSISNILVQMEKGGYTGIQLALAPWLGIEEGSLLFGGEEGEAAWQLVKDAMAAGKLDVMSTMINFPGENYDTRETIRDTQGYMYGVRKSWPDSEEHWKSNLFYTVEAAKKTKELMDAAVAAGRAEMGPKYLTTEIGYIGIDPDLMFDRIKEICESCMVYNVTFLMESGPQTGAGMTNLLARLNAAGITNVGVNYDPGDDELFAAEGAVTSFDAMWPWIMQCHIKDCKPANERGRWNEDCPWGEGYVSSLTFSSGYDFLSHLRRFGWDKDILFEYMAGDETLTPERATEIQDAMLTILRSNNVDDEDPEWADSKWVRPSVMMGEDDAARVRAAMKAQGFGAGTADVVAATEGSYLTLKNWAEKTVTTPVANPAPEDLAQAGGAVLVSAAIGAEKVLTADDVALTSAEVGENGAMTLTVQLGEGGTPTSALDADLFYAAFGILGAYSLDGVFSAENVFVSDLALDAITGTATAIAEPQAEPAPENFFLKVNLK